MNAIIDMINRARKKGDLIDKMICLFFIMIGYSNKEMQALEIRNKKFKRISKKYKKKLDAELKYKEKEKNYNIWICWFQGIDEAPEIVKKCVTSVYKYCPKNNITIITKNNMSDYIELPDYIMEKWEKGNISNTHISDILRIELLIKYGGLWIDATTLLTGEIPEYVFDNDLFMYEYYDRADITINFNTWFMYAQKENRILKTSRDLLYEYWKKENKLKEYFLLHFFLTMSIDKYKEETKTLFLISDEVSHMLQRNLLKEFNERDWNEIIKLTSVHKLTYKLDFKNNLSCKPGNSFYDYVMNMR